MKTYAVKHKDAEIVDESRSGGVFTALSETVLSSGGVIYGCILNEECVAIHSRATSIMEVKAMRGSKYVQSNLRDTFKLIKEDLLQGVFVLFTGTSCQVAGLKAFLGKEYDNLLCVDIVCHGVPSPKLLSEYIKWNGDVKSINFRNKKKYGWRDHVETLMTEHGEKDSKIWTNIFYSGNSLRPSCYKCPYKLVHHPGDITIADYWGIENAAPEFNDNKGTSLVLVNKDKGQEWFNKIKDAIVWKETRIEDSMQRAFIRPEHKPKSRDQFWKDFEAKEFSYIAKKYGGLTPLWCRVARKAKCLIRKLLSMHKRK